MQREDPEAYHKLEETVRQAMDSMSLLDIMQQFVQADTWDRIQHIVEQHLELLTDEADALVGQLEDHACTQNDEDALRVVRERRTLLRRCRQVGIEAAFETAFVEHVVTQSLPDGTSDEVRTALVEESVQALRELDELQAEDPEAFRQLGQALDAMPLEQREALVELFVQADSPEAAIAALEVRPDLRAAFETAFSDEGELKSRSENILIPPMFQADLRQAKKAERRYLHINDRVALNESIAAWERILSHEVFVNAPGNFQLAALNDAGRVFFHRYRVEGHPGDLDHALACWQQAVECALPDSSSLAMYLSNLGLGLRERYTRTKLLADLEEAIRVYERAVECIPPVSPDLFNCLNALDVALRDHYACTGNLTDVEKMVNVCKHAVKHLPSDSPHLAGFLNNLGLGLRERYKRIGALSDLEEAVRSFQQAVQCTRPDSSDLAMYLNSLGIGLREQYEYTGKVADLEESVRVWQETVQRTPPDSPDLPMYLVNLGTGLHTLYVRSGRLEGLERAISLYQEAVQRTTPDSPALPGHFSNLGNGLYERYKRTSRLADLEEAVHAWREAARHLPLNSPDLPMHLNSLGVGLNARYELSREIGDLEEAISVYREAVQHLSSNSSDLPICLNNLSISLHHRYMQLREIADLEEAISVSQEAIEHIPLDSPGLSLALNNLGNSLRSRHTHVGDIVDLEKAISVYRSAIQCAPPNSPNLPALFDNLGNSLRARYVRTGESANLAEAVRAYQHALHALDRMILASPVEYQIGQQTNWAGLTVRAVDALLLAQSPAAALAAAEGGKSRLLTTLVGRGNVTPPPGAPGDLLVQEQALAAQLAALDAAALARHGQRATAEESARHQTERQALVEGLSALWQSIAAGGSQAAAYVALRRGDRPSWDDLVRLAITLGPETALLSLFTTGERTLLFIMRAGMPAPEIVNTPLGEAGWGDLLRRFLREVHLDTPDGRRGETWARALRPLLEGAAPHLTGAQRLVFAPHTVGHYLPWGTCYTAPVVTVPALGLLKQLWERPLGTGDSALVVGNPRGDLRYAEQEAREVAAMLGVTPLVGPRATKAAVLDQLCVVGLAHFATHAYFASGSPLDSGIVLADGILTAREILERGLRAPELLALSACRTGLTGSLGGDEVAGLSQAWLYAGARTLLASLWAVDDPATAHLMSGFYRHWREGGQDKAAALRSAMDETRLARLEWAHTHYWGAFTLVGDWR